MNLGKIRALQLDLARQIETVETVCRLLDLAAGCGMNMVVLYLEDRIKTPSYPYCDDAESYSPAQIAQIHAHADALGIELVPVVSNYGHTERFLRHPELAHLAERRGGIAGRFSPPGEGAMNTVCPELPETYAFFDRYIEEVAAMFKSKYFHVGLDEIFDMGQCVLCRERMGDQGLHALLTPHILHTHALLARLGKTLMMWDDMFEECPETLTAIPRDIVLCAWHYGYISRRPDGQFNNSRRIDALDHYDELGFSYLLCPWSGLWNTNSITEYARRHKPLGMFMTTWEMSREPLHILEPLIVQAGLYWQGVMKNDHRGRLIKAVQQVTPCSDAYAAAAAESLIFCTKCGYSADVSKKIQPFTEADESYYVRASFILARLRELEAGVDPDYAEAFRHRAEYAVLEGTLHRLGQEVFDHRSGDCEEDMAAVCAELDACRETAQKMYDAQVTLWEHVRPGLACPDLTAKFEGLLGSIERLRALAQRAMLGETGRFEIHIIMPDQTTAPKTAITLTYADGTSEVLENGGVLKSRALRSPAFMLNYAMDAEKTPVSCKIEIWGYGAMYIAHADVHNAAGVFEPSGVTGITGQVTSPANLLLDDSRVAVIGEEVVQEAFRDPRLATVKHSVTLRMDKRAF
ncbi:MAG: hypothetical protein E7463_01160 [Ruminococcaceae bacterium]|nr:hypothetical protein [Oscillospiraceae bacterium]